MSFISAALVLVILITNTVRRTFNLGLFMICLGLFCLNITFGVGSVVWADNVDIKLYVYCDIGTQISRPYLTPFKRPETST